MIAQDVLSKAVGRRLANVNGVSAVYCLPRGDVFQVFTIIEDGDDEELYSRIYKQERALIHQFHEVPFDFNVVASRGRSIPEIVGSGVEIIRADQSQHQCPQFTNI